MSPLYILKGCCKVSLQPSLLQAEQTQISQPLLPGEVLQLSDHFCGPPLDRLQQLHVFPVLRAPELDAGLQVRSHQSRVEGQNHLPQPAGHTVFDAAQDMVGLLGCEHTLVAHIQPFIYQYPQVLLLRLLSVNPSLNPPVCTDIGDCLDSGAGLCTWPWWTSWGSHGPTPCPDPCLPSSLMKYSCNS